MTQVTTHAHDTQTIDRLVSEIFARDPVVTPLNFIVPLYVDAYVFAWFFLLVA